MADLSIVSMDADTTFQSDIAGPGKTLVLDTCQGGTLTAQNIGSSGQNLTLLKIFASTVAISGTVYADHEITDTCGGTVYLSGVYDTGGQDSAYSDKIDVDGTLKINLIHNASK